MYLNQKNFLFNVKELSLLLVQDANERFSADPKDIIQEKKANKLINKVDS